MTTSPPRASKRDLIIQEIGDELLVYDRKDFRIHRLGQLASVIWKNCDGRRDLAALTRLSKQQLPSANVSRQLVQLALARIEANNLLEVPGNKQFRRPSGIRRRPSKTNRGVRARTVAIASLTAPTPMMAASGDDCGGTVCSGTTPYCSSASSTCVQCLYDSDCALVGKSYCINNSCFD